MARHRKLQKAKTPIQRRTNASVLYSSKHKVENHSTASWKAPLEGLVQLAIENSLAPRTRRNYESAVRQFQKFCDEHNVPLKLRFPADEFVLSAFAASFARTKSGQTLANQLSGLKAWHDANNVPWAGGTRLAVVSRGVTNLTPEHSKKPLRPPITPQMLIWLREALDPKHPFDAAVFAVALCAFWGQCRLGELLGSSRTDTHNPNLPSLASIGHRTSTNGSREIHLPKTKTNPTHGQKIILTRQDPRIDALRAITHLIKINKSPDKSTNLFVYRHDRDNQLRALTKEQFLARCNEIWLDKGTQRFTGHSFRIGGTAELLEKGVPPDVVKEMGRWKSDAFHQYWRGISVVAPRHAENLYRHSADPVASNSRRPTQANRPCPAA